jgi:dTDP-4-dehydrorhamnose reductase
MTEGRLLVTGGSGQVGRAFGRLAASSGYEVVLPPRSALDLREAGSISAAVAAEQWDAVVNCAAYTAVDAAEREPEVAAAVNSVAPRILAAETARRDIPLIHVSTDYVFAGTKGEPYVETDPFSPANVYGSTKAEGERAVREGNSAHRIVRTSWVVSAEGDNFVRKMLRLGREREELRVVADQVGRPTAAADLARALLALVQGVSDGSGTWHFANSGDASWFDVASFVFEEAELKGIPAPRVVRISTAEFPTPARRPADSRLDTTKFSTEFGWTPRPWREALRDVIRTIL